MGLKRTQAFLVILLASSAAAAQTPVTTTTGGTGNTIPVFTSGSNVENSAITQSNGNVGIGTTTPANQLDIFGTGAITSQVTSTNSYGNDVIRSYSSTYWQGAFFSGQRADGTYASPTPVSNGDYLASYDAWGFDGSNFQRSSQIVMGADGAAAPGIIPGNIQFSTMNPSGTFTNRMFINSSGNVGIGTTAPSYPLDVAGQIHSSGGIVFPDGSIQTVAYTGTTCGADYAEAVDVTGDRTKYEPGDVLVVDPSVPGKFLKSNQPYSTLVSGIYSTKPGFVGRLQPPDPTTDASEVPMAMVGRVPTKATTENGPIHVGDLLVSSSTPGYAMKGTDHTKMLGAVVGKALGSLDFGTGIIEILVTLQ